MTVTAGLGLLLLPGLVNALACYEGQWEFNSTNITAKRVEGCSMCRMYFEEDGKTLKTVLDCTYTNDTERYNCLPGNGTLRKSRRRYCCRTDTCFSPHLFQDYPLLNCHFSSKDQAETTGNFDPETLEPCTVCATAWTAAWTKPLSLPRTPYGLPQRHYCRYLEPNANPQLENGENKTTFCSSPGNGTPCNTPQPIACYDGFWELNSTNNRTYKKMPGCNLCRMYFKLEKGVPKMMLECVKEETDCESDDRYCCGTDTCFSPHLFQDYPLLNCLFSSKDQAETTGNFDPETLEPCTVCATAWDLTLAITAGFPSRYYCRFLPPNQPPELDRDSATATTYCSPAHGDEKPCNEPPSELEHITCYESIQTGEVRQTSWSTVDPQGKPGKDRHCRVCFSLEEKSGSKRRRYGCLSHSHAHTASSNCTALEHSLSLHTKDKFKLDCCKSKLCNAPGLEDKIIDDDDLKNPPDKDPPNPSLISCYETEDHELNSTTNYEMFMKGERLGTGCKLCVSSFKLSANKLLADYSCKTPQDSKTDCDSKSEWCCGDADACLSPARLINNLPLLNCSITQATGGDKILNYDETPGVPCTECQTTWDYVSGLGTSPPAEPKRHCAYSPNPTSKLRTTQHNKLMVPCIQSNCNARDQSLDDLTNNIRCTVGKKESATTEEGHDCHACYTLISTAGTRHSCLTNTESCNFNSTHLLRHDSINFSCCTESNCNDPNPNPPIPVPTNP